MKNRQFHQLTSTWDGEQGAAQSPWAAEQGEKEEEEGPGSVAGAGTRAGFLGSRKLRALTIPK